MSAGFRMCRVIALGLVLALLTACVQEVDMIGLRERIGNDPVIMLSTSTCGYCMKMRDDLAGWNVEYLDIDVETDSNGQFAFDALEGRGVPILLVGDKIVHGYSRERAHALLNAADLIPNSSNL
jgi:glutaredoxin